MCYILPRFDPALDGPLFSYINPLKPTGPHVDQNIGVSETRVVRMFCPEKLVYLTGLHADHHVKGFVYIREPTCHYFNLFFSITLQV